MQALPVEAVRAPGRSTASGLCGSDGVRHVPAVRRAPSGRGGSASRPVDRWSTRSYVARATGPELGAVQASSPSCGAAGAEVVASTSAPVLGTRHGARATLLCRSLVPTSGPTSNGLAPYVLHDPRRLRVACCCWPPTHRPRRRIGVSMGQPHGRITGPSGVGSTHHGSLAGGPAPRRAPTRRCRRGSDQPRRRTAGDGQILILKLRAPVASPLRRPVSRGDGPDRSHRPQTHRPAELSRDREGVRLPTHTCREPCEAEPT